MNRLLIAIVGDANKCDFPDLGRQAASQIGTALARRGCRIMVFSSSQAFVEWEAVQGYLKGLSNKAEPRSIEVRYPIDLDGRFPGEKPNDPLFVRTPQSGDWEASIYPSFARLDGVVLIGGGNTTKIAGLLALGSKTPLAALGGLGGAAQQVWGYARADRNSAASDDDLNLMASKDWSDRSASQFVQSLIDQHERRIELERLSAMDSTERQRRKALTGLAIIGSLLFALVALALVESLAQGGLPRSGLWLLFGTPAVAGASGAAVRVLWDHWKQTNIPVDIRPVVMTVALGFWAGGVAGALFALPQVWLQSTLELVLLSKLAGFAAPVGLLAGLTLDKVFPKLINMDVPVDNGVLRGAGTKAKR